MATENLGRANPLWSTELFRALLRNTVFRHGFVNRFADHLNTALSAEATKTVVQRVAQAIEAEMPAHIERWGRYAAGQTTYEMPDNCWAEEVAFIIEWLDERPDRVRQHIVDHFGLSGTYELKLDTDPPDSGTFLLTARTVEAPFSGRYFQGVPLTITVIPAPGSIFAGWSDPELGTDMTVVVDPGEDLMLTARFE